MKFKFKSKEVTIKYKSTRIKYCYIWAGILLRNLRSRYEEHESSRLGSSVLQTADKTP